MRPVSDQSIADAVLSKLSKEDIERNCPFKVQVEHAGRRYEVGCPVIYTNAETGAWGPGASWINEL